MSMVMVVMAGYNEQSIRGDVKRELAVRKWRSERGQGQRVLVR